MDRKNSASANEGQEQFVKHLEQAAATVRSWPAWKQNVLGGLELKPQSTEPINRKENDGSGGTSSCDLR